MVFQMENEVPCSRALLPAYPALSLFILVMGREPPPHHLQGRPGQAGAHGEEDLTVLPWGSVEGLPLAGGT